MPKIIYFISQNSNLGWQNIVQGGTMHVVNML